jgi:hypothetical protein
MQQVQRVMNLLYQSAGMWAYLLIAAGLLLSIGAPLWPQYRHAALQQARARLTLAHQLHAQELEARDSPRGTGRGDRARQTAAREQLKRRYDFPALERAVYHAQAAAVDSRGSITASWLGRVLLLLGLLLAVRQASGASQKALVAVLITAMLVVLGGMRFELSTAAHAERDGPQVNGIEN